MSEYERRVNDKDIKAFEDCDKQQIYTQLPGFKSLDKSVQDRYIDKLFTNNAYQINQ